MHLGTICMGWALNWHSVRFPEFSSSCIFPFSRDNVLRPYNCWLLPCHIQCIKCTLWLLCLDTDGLRCFWFFFIMFKLLRIVALSRAHCPAQFPQCKAAIIHVLTVQYTCETVIRLCKYLKCLSKLQARPTGSLFYSSFVENTFRDFHGKGQVTWKTAIVYSLTSQWSKDKNLFYKIPDGEAPCFWE